MSANPPSKVSAWIDLRDRLDGAKLKLASLVQADSQKKRYLVISNLPNTSGRWAKAQQVLGFSASAQGDYLWRLVRDAEVIKPSSFHAVWPNAIRSEMPLQDIPLNLAQSEIERVIQSSLEGKPEKTENANPTNEVTPYAARQLDQPSPPALERAPTSNGRANGEQGDFGAAAHTSSRGDSTANADTGRAGARPAASLGDDAGALSIPSRGAPSERTSPNELGAEGAEGIERRSSLPGDDGRGNRDLQSPGRVEGPAGTQAKQDEDPVEAMVQAVMAHTAEITESQALQLVAGKTEKAGGVDPARQISASKGNPRTLRVGNIPLELFRPNENGDRYDSTVDIALARDYASRPANNAPAVIAVVSRKTGSLNINDGGHRISAARLRGDATLNALVYLPTQDTPKAAKLEKPETEAGSNVQTADLQSVLDSRKKNNASGIGGEDKALIQQSLDARAAAQTQAARQESQAEKSEREFGENYNRVANTDDLSIVSAKDIARAIGWASRRKQSEGRKGWDGGQVDENILSVLDSEIVRLKAEEARRVSATQPTQAAPAEIAQIQAPQDEPAQAPVNPTDFLTSSPP